MADCHLAPQQIPVRPASPLPPNVPTGPRNQNRYKDRDGNAPAVEGLDYGGGVQGLADVDDRINRYVVPLFFSWRNAQNLFMRKRRASPGQEDGRSLKRR